MSCHGTCPNAPAEFWPPWCREYIETGEPVASHCWSQRGRARTCRRRPSATSSRSSRTWATSGSRTPRPAACRPTCGYRFYVDLLLEGRRAARAPTGVEARLRQEAGEAPLMDDLLSHVSHVLSRGLAPRRLRDRARARARRASSASSSCRSAARACSSWSWRSGGQVSQKMWTSARRCSADELRAGRQLPEHRVRGPPLDEVRDGVSSGCARSGRCTTSCWPARCGWPAARSTNLPAADRRLHRGRVVAARARSCRRAASPLTTLRRAAADDRGEAAAGAAAERIHRRPRPDRRDRRRAQRPRTAARSAWWPRPTPTGAARARSA